MLFRSLLTKGILWLLPHLHGADGPQTFAASAYDSTDYLFDADDARLVLVNANLPFDEEPSPALDAADEAGTQLEAEAAQQYRSMADTDRMMEKDTGMRIAEYYQSAGPDAFTAKEKEIINRVRFYHEAVIAMGGNYPMTEEKFHLLSEHGVVILLYAKPFRLAERVRRRIGKRPTMDYSDVDGYVRQMLRKWTKWRDRVDLVINTTNCHPEQTALMIARYIDKHNIGFAARRGPGYPGREEHTEKRERNGRPSSHGRRSQ